MPASLVRRATEELRHSRVDTCKPRPVTPLQNWPGRHRSLSRAFEGMLVFGQKPKTESVAKPPFQHENGFNLELVELDRFKVPGLAG